MLGFLWEDSIRSIASLRCIIATAYYRNGKQKNKNRRTSREKKYNFRSRDVIGFLIWGLTVEIPLLQNLPISRFQVHHYCNACCIIKNITSFSYTRKRRRKEEELSFPNPPKERKEEDAPWDRSTYGKFTTLCNLFLDTHTSSILLGGHTC